MPEIPYSTIQKHRCKGAVGFPIIRHCYRAAILDQIKAWFEPDSTKLWVQIEKSILQNRDLPPYS